MNTVNPNHCARFVFLSRAIDKTDSPLLCSECGVWCCSSTVKAGRGSAKVSGGLAETEGIDDVGDAERRGMKDADGAEGFDDVGGAAGANDVGRDAGQDDSVVTGTG